MLNTSNQKTTDFQIEIKKSNLAKNVFLLFSIIGIAGYYLMIQIGSGFSEEGKVDLDISSMFFGSILFITAINLIERYFFKRLKLVSLKKINFKTNDLFFWFFICLIAFILYPWDSIVQTPFHSLSSICRYIWLFCGIRLKPHLKQKHFFKSKQFLYLIMTTILAIVDSSRTIWFLALLTIFILSLDIFYLIVSFVFLFLLLCTIAGIRSGWSLNTFIFSSIYGEGFGATTDYLSIRFNTITDSIESIYYIIDVFLTPIIYPLNKILGILQLDSLNINSLVLGKVENVMGGWFIGNTFAFYNSGQYFLVFAYMLISYFFTVLFIGPISPILSRIIPIIAIKSSPFVYWNFIYYIVFFCLIFYSLRRISLKLN